MQSLNVINTGRIWKMQIDLMFILNLLVIIGIIASAILAVVSKGTLSSVLALGATGAFMTLEFILLHAPDVAIAEASVGVVLSTAIFIVAIKKTTAKGDEEK